MNTPFSTFFTPRIRAQLEFGDSNSSWHEKEKNGLMVKSVKSGKRKSVYPSHELNAIAQAITKGYSQDQIKQLVSDLMVARSKIEIPTFEERE